MRTQDMETESPHKTPGQLLIYEDGAARLQVRLEGKTVWLPQKALAELFQTSVPNINQHLKTIYAEGELRAEATIKPYLIVQQEGSRDVSRVVNEVKRLDTFTRAHTALEKKTPVKKTVQGKRKGNEE